MMFEKAGVVDGERERRGKEAGSFCSGTTESICCAGSVCLHCSSGYACIALRRDRECRMDASARWPAEEGGVGMESSQYRNLHVALPQCVTDSDVRAHVQKGYSVGCGAPVG